jgi:hypothetical protein
MAQRTFVRESDLIDPLISELHDLAEAQGLRPVDFLDLATVIAERGSVPSARQVAELTTHFRAQSGATIATTVAIANEALERATKRATALGRARGGRSTFTKSSPTDAEALLAIRVNIKDWSAFGRLTPAGVERYLKARGWIRTSDHPHKSEAGIPLGGYWSNNKGSELLVPADVASDYTAGLAQVVVDLEIVENRSQMLIYRDLIRA